MFPVAGVALFEESFAFTVVILEQVGERSEMFADTEQAVKPYAGDCGLRSYSFGLRRSSRRRRVAPLCCFSGILSRVACQMKWLTRT